MKKLLCLALALVLALTAACAPQTGSAPGLRPWEPSREEEDLLELLGLSDRVGLVEFTAPEGAVGLEVNAYALKDGAWRPLGGGAVTRDQDDGPWEGLAVLESREDYGINLRLRSQGVASYTVEGVPPETEPQGWSRQFLSQSREPALGEEVPVALFLYSGGGSLATHDLADFADPQAFAGEGLALVQAVTLTFT